MYNPIKNTQITAVFLLLLLGMPSSRHLLIVGGSGAGRDVLSCALDVMDIDLRSASQCIRFLETEAFALRHPTVLGIPVLCEDAWDPAAYDVVVAIGNPEVRQRVVTGLQPDTRFATLRHPTAVIASDAKIGEGSVIAAGSVITLDVRIGAHAHLNLHTSVTHEARIGDFFTAGPGVRLSGNATIGHRVEIGTSASIRQGITITDDVTIGMGAVVVNDILEPGTYVGNPARRLR
jgi:sugar O-acyltransferase (sialic acid O-acetyltransferase NeuD family)